MLCLNKQLVLAKEKCKEDNIDEDIFKAAKCSIEGGRIKVEMPSNVNMNDMKKCFAATFVMAGEKDYLFPAKIVIPLAECNIHEIRYKTKFKYIKDMSVWGTYLALFFCSQN